MTACGCVSPIDGGWGIPPFFEVYRDVPSPDGKSTRTRVAVRPFVLHDSHEKGRDTRVLWPLYRSKRDGDNEKDWILLLWYRNKHVEPDGTVDLDNAVFPLFFWGHDPREGGYFLFFPVFGTSKGLLGQDRIDFVLFPLYAKAQDRNRISRHYLWPIFNTIDSPIRGGGRFFPFYGRYTATTPAGQPKYDRRFYAWPLFHAHENNLDTENPVQARWFFPFYGKISSENLTRTSVLWPLYTTVRTKDTRVWAMPLLPIIISRGPDQSQTDLWPIYGLKRRENESGLSVRQYFLWPIQRYEYSNVGHREAESFYFLPFYWQRRQHDLRTGQTTQTHRLWPLVTSRVHADGTHDVHFLDLFPFTDDEHFDPLYSRIWRIYRYRDRGVERGSDWELFWGLIKGSRRPTGRSFSLLGGLLGRDASSGDTRWRILYIPF